MKYFLFILLLLYLPISSFSQEMSWEVKINSERVSTQEKQVFVAMQKDISEFLNNRRWTKDDFKDFEKIKCGLSINLRPESAPSDGYYRAEVLIQTSRPVYNSTYVTPVLSFFDSKWTFNYNIGDPINFNESVYTTELSLILSYYAYIALGMDYDTFSKNGGEDFYEKALNLASLGESNNTPGWNTFKSADQNDRIFIIKDLVKPALKSYREAMYEYHRLGLDLFDSNPEEARIIIYAALEKFKAVKNNVNYTVLIETFFRSKYDEIFNVFSKGDPEIADQAGKILIQLDPSHSSKYKKLLKIQ